ncbi:MAG: DUF2723 domain-containing protein [Candidatus Abyssobacteria bacterium SURF_17]|uniref:DUF2723 domain-containing protein n=1 Tax=Candidatus Abyssobacteria bacterium SURF_17 TaxID=2093361 RepID=A0A419F8K2_9BACT|nr:MAG: DUF2723 domain-containing protein [Candidatus Abyssubacteria bacterium SURF_17]
MKTGQSKAFVLPALVFGVTFGLYSYTACPTVYWDDAGELIAACYTLGVPHPPGHPLYAILGKLFTLMPIGSPAFRVNIMSAFFGALTCALLFQIVKELVCREEGLRRYAHFAAGAAALSLALCSLMWEQSVVAETTTLHSFFMLIVTLIAFRIEFSGEDDPRITKRLLLLSFVYGLSFTNHVAGLFFAPSLALLLLFRLRLKLFKPGRLFAMFALFLLGLVVYAYLPLSSRSNPAIDWGNPETLSNFIWVVTARQYSANLLRVPTLSGFLWGLGNIFQVFLSDMTPFGLFLALIGALRLWRTSRTVVVYGSVIVLILFSVSLNSAFISAYLVPAELMLMLWAGFGIAFLCERAGRVAIRLSGVRQAFMTYAPFCAVLLLVLFQAFVHFPENNMRQYWHAREYGVHLLSSLPENAILITGTADPLFIAWYLQYCENFRIDVKVITRNGLTRPGYLEQVRREHPELDMPHEFQFEGDEGARPSHIQTREAGLPWYANSYFKLLYEQNAPRFPMFWEGIEANQLLIEQFVPHDLVFRIVASGRSPDPHGPNLLNVDEIVTRIGDDTVAGRVYGNHAFNYGIYYQWHNDGDAARYSYEEALRLNPDDTRALNNLGALLAALGNVQEAHENFMRAFRVNPNDLTSNHNVGQSFMIRGEFHDAIPYFRRAVRLDVPKFEDYYNLGLCYAEVGRSDSAVRMFKEALVLRPESPEALSSLGVIYLRQGATESAEKLLKAALDIEPTNAENWYNLACLQVLQGDTQASSRSLKKALTIDYHRTYTLASNDHRLLPILESLVKNN